MSEDIQETKESASQASNDLNILVKKAGRPRKNFVASPQQQEELREKIAYHESVVAGGMSAKGERMGSVNNSNKYSPAIDTSGHKREAEKLKNDLEKCSPIAYRGMDKDKAYKRAQAIKETFREHAPTVEEMNHATGQNIRKNTNWLYKTHKIDDVNMTGDQAQLEYQKIMRSIDPEQSVIEDHRRGR